MKLNFSKLLKQNTQENEGKNFEEDDDVLNETLVNAKFLNNNSLLITSKIVPNNSSVLYLGCTDAKIANFLVKDKGCNCHFLDCMKQNLEQLNSAGHKTTMIDYSFNFSEFAGQNFDFIILDKFLQYWPWPADFLKSSTKAAKFTIVSFHNSAFWKSRFRNLIFGRIDSKKTPLNKKWYNSTLMRSFSVIDFLNLCKDKNIVLEKGYYANSRDEIIDIEGMQKYPNWLGTEVVCVLGGTGGIGGGMNDFDAA